MRLVISLATRGRPQQLLDTIRRSIANWVVPSTRMMVQCDDDDVAAQQYLHAHEKEIVALGERVMWDWRKREDTIAAKWNRCLGIDADVYSVAADDDPYITK